VALQCFITLTVAPNVKFGVITSSPFFTPSASNDNWSAAVPLLQLVAYFVPQYSANFSSNFFTKLP